MDLGFLNTLCLGDLEKLFVDRYSSGIHTEKGEYDSYHSVAATAGVYMNNRVFVKQQYTIMQ